MPGEVDTLYAAARSVLLDALEALGAQRDAVILVSPKYTLEMAPSAEILPLIILKKIALKRPYFHYHRKAA